MLKTFKSNFKIGLNIMISPIDDILQPGMQFLFLVSMVVVVLMRVLPRWMYKNDILKWFSQYEMILYIVAGCGIYHFLLLPILFVHEFGGYEGYDYRVLFQDENGEPMNQNILFRKDKNSPLEALHGVIEDMKQYGDKSTDTILSESLELNDTERIRVLASKIDGV